MKTETEAVCVSASDYEQAKTGAEMAARGGVCRLVFSDQVLLDRWTNAVAAHQLLLVTPH